MPHYLFCNQEGLILNYVQCPDSEVNNQSVSGAAHVIEVPATKVPDFIMNDVTVDLLTGDVLASTPKQFEFDADQAMRSIRKKRDKLLASSDWTQVSDVQVDQSAWAAYRQALRDIPQQEGFPENIVWPTKPQ